MKRALLIAGGTVGGLGAVLAITPPQITSSESGVSIGGTTAIPAANTTTAAPAATSSKSPSPNASATKSATPTKTAAATKSAAAATKSAAATTETESPQATASASATPTPTKNATTKSVSGTFTGDVINVGYGNVQVQLTVVNGKITDAQAVQAPSGRNDRWTQMAVPVLRQRTLAAQSANITGVSGASYTSYGWYKSLVSALSKAGL